MLHKLKGSGLLNVYLNGGVSVEGVGDEQTIAYSDLDGLYRALARAIALRLGQMSGDELRFLRKRLGMSQSDVAALGGKTDQVVAKWEKVILPVPKAEANLLRFAVLSKFGTHTDMARLATQLTKDAIAPVIPYVMTFDGIGWKHDSSLAIITATEQARPIAVAALDAAKSSSQHAVKYTSSERLTVPSNNYSQFKETSKLWQEGIA